MGTFTVRIEVAALSGDRFIATDTLVDTGATYTLLPRKILRDLGVHPIDRMPFQLAEEREVQFFHRGGENSTRRAPTGNGGRFWR